MRGQVPSKRDESFRSSQAWSTITICMGCAYHEHDDIISKLNDLAQRLPTGTKRVETRCKDNGEHDHAQILRRGSSIHNVLWHQAAPDVEDGLHSLAIGIGSASCCGCCCTPASAGCHQQHTSGRVQNNVNKCKASRSCHWYGRCKARLMTASRMLTRTAGSHESVATAWLLMISLGGSQDVDAHATGPYVGCQQTEKSAYIAGIQSLTRHDLKVRKPLTWHSTRSLCSLLGKQPALGFVPQKGGIGLV